MTGIDVASLIDQLVKNRIAIHSFAVGPAQNSAVLASLANQTGGVLVFDGEKITGAEAGSQLSHAAHGPVIWPSDRKLPASLAEAFPTRTPPLRSDRDTILIGKGSATDDFAVQIEGESAGKPVNLEWNVTATKPSDDNAFLAQLTGMAETDGGLGLPTLGSEGLWEVRRVLNMQAHSLAKLGQQAAATGDVQKARQFVNAAMERDPNDSNALVLKRSLDQTQFQPGTPPPPAPGDVEPPQPQPGDLLNSVEQRQQVIQQQVMTEATVDMNRAHDKMTTDPGAVIDDLKRLMDRVLRVTELTSEQRADLRGRISTLLQQANQSQMIKDAADAERQQNLAAARDRQRTLDRIAAHRNTTRRINRPIQRTGGTGLYECRPGNQRLFARGPARCGRPVPPRGVESVRPRAGGGHDCPDVCQFRRLPDGRHGGERSRRTQLHGYAAPRGHFAYSVPRFAADCVSRCSVLAENQQRPQREVFSGRLVVHEPDRTENSEYAFRSKDQRRCRRAAAG